MSSPAASASDGALPSVSVVVPTHRRHEQVLALVDLLLSEPDAHEVVVVVDGPDDLLCGLLAERDDPRLLVRVTPGVGPASARLEGARAATGEVLLLLDDDLRPLPGTVRGHAERHARQPGGVVLGHAPVALPPRRGRGEAATWLYAAEYDQAWQTLVEDPSLVLDQLRGMSLPRTALLAAGDDPWPTRYHEDEDLGRRLQLAGLRGVAAPSCGRSTTTGARSPSPSRRPAARRWLGAGRRAR